MQNGNAFLAMLTSLRMAQTGESELTDKRMASILPMAWLMLPSAVPFSKTPAKTHSTHRNESSSLQTLH